MIGPQSISIYLNKALKPTDISAELDCEAPLPETVRDMPDVIGGRFVEVDEAEAEQIKAAWKRVMTLNATQVLYTFSYDPPTHQFKATKR